MESYEKLEHLKQQVSNLTDAERRIFFRNLWWEYAVELAAEATTDIVPQGTL